MQLQMVDDFDLEITRQNEYLGVFGLFRQPIIGDGNCLFRAISLSLFGDQDHHLELRETAINEIQQNLNEFRMSFYHDSDNMPMTDQEIEIELNNLRQFGTYAGQECILALSRHFHINILVTFGGDIDNPNVVTHEHNFGQSDSQIHLVWTRFGGGHYESVLENPALHINEQSQNDLSKSKPSSKYVWKENMYCRKYDLYNLVNQKTQQSGDYIKNIHSYGKEKEPEVSEKNQCSQCKKKFYDRSTLLRHKKKVHEKESKNHENRVSCFVPSCDLNFFHIENLIEHLINAHSADIEIENLEFENMGAFDKFKEEESLQKNTRFVLHRSIKTNKDGSKNFILICHRDGKKRCIDKTGKRRNNKKGSCKIEGLCLSRMSVSVGIDGTVKVKYIKSHSHSLDFGQSKFLPIPENIKSEISTMLALKIPISNILDKIRENFCDRDNREDMKGIKHYHLIDRKTIHNIKQKIVDSSVIKHSDDATSTFLRVESLRKEKFDPVLIYKQQDVVDQTLGLDKGDFMLAIMTKQQLTMYEKFAPIILCMDSTHKTNIYSFKLITLLVPDEFRNGYPVAFCISNKEDEKAISIFLQSVKNRSPQTKVKIIMTDDDNSGWNAAQKVYGPDLKQFLCIWHVHRNWRRRIQQHIKESQLQTEIYYLLCSALQTKSENYFNQYIQGLVRKNKETDIEGHQIPTSNVQDKVQIVSASITSQSKMTKIKEIQDKLKIISDQVQNDKSVQDHRLDNVLLALNHIISANEGCKKISRSFLQFSKTEKITSNAINEKQPRFRRTEKTAGRKRKAPLRKPSEGEKIKLLENLQQNQDFEGENSISDMQNSDSDQTSSRDNEQGANLQTSELGPSVAPYPPLRLVHPSQPANLPIQTTEPLFNVFSTTWSTLDIQNTPIFVW
ncbi:uncharacterized protein LOC133192343 [Saccostrea echinata]|uniref:uncharacterized protein LOC133192343 n=1 Tax=Saccostrea echinata TaxID=191078 RepID=UPI002A81E590|nr:uncharacterized protein LOC133192343 [Saccostrea echinata]